MATSRRGAIDLARVGALVLVVVGHLSLAVIDRGADGELRGDNLLSLQPHLAWLAMLAPMPVFFAAAGWANAAATPATSAPRLRTLVGVGAAVVVTWSTAAVLESVLRDEGGIVADGARLATQPLWFLAVYVPFTAAGARISRLASHPVTATACCLAALGALDVARFVGGAPDAIGWPGFVLAWGVPWLLGAAWRGRVDAGHTDERLVGARLALGGAAAAAALVLFGGYFPSLIDAVDGERSNTTPPTLFTAVASIVQVGLLMCMASRLDRWAARWRTLLDRAAEAAVGIYAWHLSALALCAALLAAGMWAPERFSPMWWLTRPLWFGLVLSMTGVFVAITSATRRHRRGDRLVAPARAMAGIVLATVGASVVGRWGPRTMPGAVVGVVGFVGGWWFLRGGRALPDRAVAS